VGLRQFFADHPFELNVFAMTRFQRIGRTVQPIPWRRRSQLPVRYASFRLELHLVSDQAIHDDLWTNVIAHMWAGMAWSSLRIDRDST